MPLFRASFMKTVTDSFGYDRDICQRAVLVEAPDRDEAIRSAQRQFCSLENIRSWSYRADAISVNELKRESAEAR